MTDNSEIAGQRLVDRLAKHYGVHSDVDLAARLGKGKSKQHIYSMRGRTKSDINYDIIMQLLDELEAKHGQ